jgi:plastocyanin
MRMPASTPRSKLVVLTHRKTVHVAIENLAFVPARIVVSPGTRIVWTNKDQLAHTSTADQGLWESGQLNSGDDFSRAFKRTGTFKYHCTIHPFMHGAITVSSS